MLPRASSWLCIAAAVGALWGGAYAATPAGAPARAMRAVDKDPSADIQQQYERVLSVIRQPPVTGVLVTEVLPESAAGAAGLRGGDIITQFDGETVTGLHVLREKVADAVAERLEDGRSAPLVLRARRTHPDGKPQEITALVRREPLGIRAVEVQAAVEGPRNPPPSLRGKITLDWQAVADALRTDNGVFALRTYEPPSPDDAPSTRPAADEDTPWVGWQRYHVTADGTDKFAATIELARVDSADENASLLEQATFAFRLRHGDYYTAPAFLLESMSATYTGPDGSKVQADASRVGESLRAQVQQGSPGATALSTPIALARHAPLTALVQPAAPIAAAAMPHEPGAVLPVHLVSVRDFVARPGYVLATRGKQPLPSARARDAVPPTDTAWRVDLLHFGVAVESYWFSQNRRLLCVQSGLGTPVVSRRVLNPADVSRPAARRPSATRPAG